jgi:hypothetical protein
MSKTSDFIEKMYPNIVLSDAQKEMVKAIESGQYTRQVRRPARSSFMTTLHLAEFNLICSETEKSIEWHAKDWVAMDRKHYEKLVRAAERNKVKIYYDEYLSLTSEDELEGSHHDQ